MSEGSKVPIRVVVADDHTIVREGIRQVLDGTEGITVVGEAATGPDAVAKALAQRDATRTSVHMISNLLVTVLDPVSVEINATITAYHATPPAGGKGPATDAHPSGMFRAVEVWRKTAQGWKIADKKNLPLMRFAH